MRRIAFVLLYVVLLTACVPSVQNIPATKTTTMNTEGQSITETENPAIDATESSGLQTTPDQTAVNAYLGAYQNIYVFIYNENFEYDRLDGFIDRSSMITGVMYSIDVEIGSIFVVTDKSVVTFMKASEYIYYVLKAEPDKVYRTDHQGKNSTVIYESTHGAVTFLQYYGSDSKGKLLMAIEGKGIVEYNIATDENTVLMEAYLVGQFYYSPSSLIFDHVVQHINAEELGQTIYWKGKLHESDPDKPDGDTYYYFVDICEHWDVANWKPVK